MEQGPKAKIFLAGDRDCKETDRFRTYNTFNFGENYNQYKNAFNDLYILNEDTIAGNSSIHLQVEKSSYILLLPLVGSVLCKINKNVQAIVSPGQLQVLSF